jgi:MoxR-like ATPase
MAEGQVTENGVTYVLPKPFFVIATENPVETQGTFPLPEAQLDRFFMRLKLGYMTKEQEISVLRRPDTRTLLESLQPVIQAEELQSLRETYPQVRVSDDIAAYIMNLVDATRSSEMLLTGISTRGTLALYRACQIIAALRGRDYVIPEDVKLEALCVLPHRLTLVNQSHLDNVQYLQNLLDGIPVPLEQL